VAEERAPAVAVLDVSMPGIDGYETTRRVRAAVPDVRVMLLTARVTEGDRERGREAGADDQLDKPFSPATLGERVRRLLS
jgi:DNA-binding response OmpR family regulator